MNRSRLEDLQCDVQAVPPTGNASPELTSPATAGMSTLSALVWGLLTIVIFALVLALAVFAWWYVTMEARPSESLQPKVQDPAPSGHPVRSAAANPNAFKSLRCVPVWMAAPVAQRQATGPAEEPQDTGFSKTFQEWLQSEIPARKRALTAPEFLGLTEKALVLKKELQHQKGVAARRFVEIMSNKDLLVEEITRFVRDWPKLQQLKLYAIATRQRVQLERMMATIR